MQSRYSVVRPLGEEDLDAMTALEGAAWPVDVQASRAQLRDRLVTFANGVLGAWVDRRLVGMASSQVVHFGRDRSLRSWRDLTAEGWISRTHDPSANCLHFVSICVHPNHRAVGIGSALNRGRLDLARRMSLAYALSDTRLPSLADYIALHPGGTPSEYVGTLLRNDLREPAVHMYRRLGFEPLGLIADCMSSDRESANFGLAMLKELHGKSGD